jgi:hypothetical protein
MAFRRSGVRVPPAPPRVGRSFLMLRLFLFGLRESVEPKFEPKQKTGTSKRQVSVFLMVEIVRVLQHCVMHSPCRG